MLWGVGLGALGGGYQPGELYQLASFGGWTLTYGVDGNLTGRSKSGFNQTLGWNAPGQLQCVTTSGMTTTFGYDGWGRRVRKSTGIQSEQYLYYPGVDRPRSVRRGNDGKLHYYLADALGNVTGLVDRATIRLVNEYCYDAWGASERTREAVALILTVARGGNSTPRRGCTTTGRATMMRNSAASSPRT